jgi:hypothetical protein
MFSVFVENKKITKLSKISSEKREEFRKFAEAKCKQICSAFLRRKHEKLKSFVFHYHLIMKHFSEGKRRSLVLMGTRKKGFELNRESA